MIRYRHLVHTVEGTPRGVWLQKQDGWYLCGHCERDMRVEVAVRRCSQCDTVVHYNCWDVYGPPTCCVGPPDDALWD